MSTRTSTCSPVAEQFASTATDADRELAISVARRHLELAHQHGDVAGRETAKDRFYALIRGRSAGQIERMERSLGLQ